MKIDLNCDLGEGGSDDAQLMQLVTSCNIACGGHFGDQQSVYTAVQLAVENEVNIGAHPSYPDKENFGRKKMLMPLNDLMQSIQGQILLVKEAAEAKSAEVKHVKPHGALYHELISDEEKANAFVDLVERIDRQLSIFAPPLSILHKIAKNRINTFVEGFADRAYDSSYNLISRQHANSLLTEAKDVGAQVLSMLKDGRIILADKNYLTCSFDTICIHGDNPNALEILQYLHQLLDQNSIQIKAL